jgi:hypothetical protein
VVQPSTAVAPSPQSEPDLCSVPNPRRAVISQELLEWHDWLVDGGFETGEAEVVVADREGYSPAMVQRTGSAARTGSYGYAITAGHGEGISFRVKGSVEKGNHVRFSFWAQSPDGQVSLRPVILGGKKGQDVPELFVDAGREYPIGPEWTQVTIEGDNVNLEYVLLTLDVGPDTALHIDDVAMEQHIFRMADYPSDEARTVGGIAVPNEPIAPVHIAVLIHIEDPPLVHVDEGYFGEQTAIMRDLAEILHRHGGQLTIQPEEDWPLASDTWSPGLLAELVQDYGVVYSTHTHGPHCRDDQGRLRSLMDCQEHRDTPEWDQTPNSHENPWVVEYVHNLRDLLSQASGTQVTDHNGNWEFTEASTYAQIPMLTWSAYKNWRTQHTYDVLINNPWRPSESSADMEIEAFLTHDPATQIVYIPGYGQNVARFLDRLHISMAPLVSQFIRFADPDRVNTFYVVTHVGSFYPRDSADVARYADYDPATGEIIYSDLFRQDLQHWDDMLTELIDPLVAEGYLQWTSLPEMGRLYLEWEQDNCP